MTGTAWTGTHLIVQFIIGGPPGHLTSPYPGRYCISAASKASQRKKKLTSPQNGRRKKTKRYNKKKTDQGVIVS